MSLGDGGASDWGGHMGASRFQLSHWVLRVLARSGGFFLHYLNSFMCIVFS
jgi:hypothetical protein